jgi:glycosyltransferase involved in cell wall biosynthesis
MRIAYINRKKTSWIGGDFIQMENTAKALRDLGVTVDIFDTPFPLPIETIDSYDIVHTWNFTMQWSQLAIWMAKKHKKKVVCSMIYHAVSQIPMNLQQIMADNTDLAIFICEDEFKRTKENKLKINKKCFIPNGIDSWWLDPIDVKTEDFVLSVGRIDGTKGQLRTAEKCKKLGYKFKMVGEIINEDYYDKCLELGAEYLGVKHGADLKEIYAKCRVFALESNTEIMPLTVMEAGALNKPVILTNCSFKFPGISASLEEAWNKKDNEELFSFIKKTTWSDIAKKVKKQYENININSSLES